MLQHRPVGKRLGAFPGGGNGAQMITKTGALDLGIGSKVFQRCGDVRIAGLAGFLILALLLSPSFVNA